MQSSETISSSSEALEKALEKKGTPQTPKTTHMPDIPVVTPMRVIVSEVDKSPLSPDRKAPTPKTLEKGMDTKLPQEKQAGEPSQDLQTQLASGEVLQFKKQLMGHKDDPTPLQLTAELIRKADQDLAAALKVYNDAAKDEKMKAEQVEHRNAKNKCLNEVMAKKTAKRVQNQSENSKLW